MYWVLYVLYDRASVCAVTRPLSDVLQCSVSPRLSLLCDRREHENVSQLVLPPLGFTASVIFWCLKNRKEVITDSKHDSDWNWVSNLVWTWAGLLTVFHKKTEIFNLNIKCSVWTPLDPRCCGGDLLRKQREMVGICSSVYLIYFCTIFHIFLHYILVLLLFYTSIVYLIKIENHCCRVSISEEPISTKGRQYIVQISSM